MNAVSPYADFVRLSAAENKILDLELDTFLSDLPSGDGVQAALAVPSEHAPPLTAKQNYCFPRDIKFARADQRQLDDLLHKVCQGTLKATGRRRDYLGVRQTICSINLAMNRLGLRPPAFRDSRKVPKVGFGESPEWAALAHDRKIIDLHWLHSTGTRLPLQDIHFGDLLMGDHFDLDMAQRFVAEEWKTEARVNQIMLMAPFDQWQLSVLISEAVRKRRAAIDVEARGVGIQLRQASLQSNRLHPDDVADFIKLWIASQVCAGAPQYMIGRHHGWQCGRKPLAPTTISQKLKKMRRWVI